MLVNKVIENDLIELSKRPVNLNKLKNKSIIIFGINGMVITIEAILVVVFGNLRRGYQSIGRLDIVI